MLAVMYVLDGEVMVNEVRPLLGWPCFERSSRHRNKVYKKLTRSVSGSATNTFALSDGTQPDIYFSTRESHGSVEGMLCLP